MASNSFGTQFKITTWGESHGEAIGVLIDGVPAGIAVTENEINIALAKRAPGQSPYTSPRKEEDKVKILSGLFDNQTTGAPVFLMINNTNHNSNQYRDIKNTLRPGHANFTYIEKYGIFDYRGGGRASARETAARVAAGAVAKKINAAQGIKLVAFVKSVGTVCMSSTNDNIDNLIAKRDASCIGCPDASTSDKIVKQISDAREEGDSVGGVIECHVHACPVGLGDPVYEKIEAKLASAMMSIPATKGFEIGQGFAAAQMKGSEHNDGFVAVENNIKPSTNHAGGTLGGITTGEKLVFRVAFKPTSSIKIQQQSVTLDGENTTFQIPKDGRHDPCVAIRAVAVVEAMCHLVLADCILLNRLSRLDNK